MDEIRPQYTDTTNGSAVFASTLTRSLGPDITATIDQLDNQIQEAVGQDKVLATPFYSDQILPFDVTLAGANEYGAMCSSKIFGIEILNEGTGVSIDDAVTEGQATFVARSLESSGSRPEPLARAEPGRLETSSAH